MMCIDILEQEKIVTYREKEHDLLMDIRNNKPLEIGDKISFDFVIGGYDYSINQNITLIEEEVEYTVIGIYQQIENKY